MKRRTQVGFQATPAVATFLASLPKGTRTKAINKAILKVSREQKKVLAGLTSAQKKTLGL
jgi:hypothetical protein